MADQPVIGGGKVRPDSLPHPSSVGEQYLAAILDEIRALRGERPVSASGEVRVKEPQGDEK